jgi:hypothetical protein
MDSVGNREEILWVNLVRDLFQDHCRFKKSDSNLL